MSDITKFIAHAREKGMDHSTIRALLVDAGWKEKDVVDALAEATLDFPPPHPPEKGGAKDVFLQLSITVAYYATSIAVVVILIHAIDRLFPDAAEPEYLGTWRKSSIRWSIAYILIAYPLFLFFTRRQIATAEVAPDTAPSTTRRWLTYLTIFVAGLALVIDVITLLYFMLEGELTTRFLLKVGCVLGVAGLTFAYFLFTLSDRQDDARDKKIRRAFLITSLIAVGGTVAWGFAITGSPGAERDRKLDERRRRDLETISEEIARHCLGTTRHNDQSSRVMENPLPETLGDIRADARRRRPRVVDPETDEPYRYEILSDHRYRLGARFKTTRDESHDPFWNHEATEVWFEFDLLKS